MLSSSCTASTSGQGQLSTQGKADEGSFEAVCMFCLHCAARDERGGQSCFHAPANEAWHCTAGVPLASVTHQGQAITYIAVPTGPSQINPQMQHALMKHAMASGLPGLQEQHGHALKFEGGPGREGQAAAHVAGHAAGQLRVWAPGPHARAASSFGASCAQASQAPCANQYLCAGLLQCVLAWGPCCWGIECVLRFTTSHNTSKGMHGTCDSTHFN